MKHQARLAIGVVALIVEETASASLMSTFDLDLEGWASTRVKIDYIATGGNPGGFLRANDLSFESFITAPGKFIGDLSNINGGTLSFDMKLFSTDLTPAGQGGNVTLRSGSIEVTRNIIDVPSLPVPSEWTSGSIALTAEAWGLGQPAWMELLSNVTAIEIVVDPSLGANNLDITGFDNFRIQAVPVPSALFLFGSGVLTFFGISYRKLA